MRHLQKEYVEVLQSGLLCLCSSGFLNVFHVCAWYRKTVSTGVGSRGSILVEWMDSGPGFCQNTGNKHRGKWAKQWFYLQMGSGDAEQQTKGEYNADVTVPSFIACSNRCLSFAGDPRELWSGGEQERWSIGVSKGKRTPVSSKAKSQAKLAMQTVDRTMSSEGI